MNFGLSRTARLSNLVSQKYHQQSSFQPPWKVAHIAGTNGKGSVAAYLAALLKRAGSSHQGRHEAPNKTPDGQDRGLRVGRYTSPHFIDRWDCIVVNDKPVPEDVFKRAEIEVTALAQQAEHEVYEENKSRLASNANTQGQPWTDIDKDEEEVIRRDARATEFEILTAIAFKIFSDPNPTPCDIAIIECGLGGQQDATNILPASSKIVTIITAIGLDHVDILGGNLRSIVRQKCGILREGVPVVVDGENSEEVLGMIREEVRQRFGAEWASNMVFYARGVDLKPLLDEADQNGRTSSTETKIELRYPRLQALLPHQLSNLATAVKAFEIIRALNIIPALASNSKTSTASPLSPSLLETVLEDTSTSYPARLQLLSPGWLSRDATTTNSNPTSNSKLKQKLPILNTHPLLLDGAHNVQSALVLREYITRFTKPNSTSPQVSKSIPTIYILGLSSTKPPVEILQALFPPTTPSPETSLGTSNNVSATPQARSDDNGNVKIVFTSFSTPPSMPWVRCTPSPTLLSAAEQVGLGGNVLGTTGDIVEALQLVEDYLSEQQHETHKPLVVVAGSLYLASDFLRVLRDEEIGG